MRTKPIDYTESRRAVKKLISTSKPLHKTQQEWDAAKKKLVAIVEVDYGSGDHWLGFAYETGLLRIRFATGDTIGAQAPDAEAAIESMQQIAVQAGRMAYPCGGLHLMVHRVPANCKGPDGLNNNTPHWLTSIGLDCEIQEWKGAA
jgi:hypothetical protein